MTLDRIKDAVPKAGVRFGGRACCHESDMTPSAPAQPFQLPVMKSPRLRQLTFVLCLLSSVLCLAGCARRETPVQAGIRTQTLLVGNAAEPVDLDPHVIIANRDGNIVFALFEGLTVSDEKTGQGLPAAAERWDVSTDGRSYLFHLRPNLAWSNGDRLTAHDFVFSFQRSLNPKLAANMAFMLRPIKGAEAFNIGKVSDPASVGAVALDDRTLRIELEQPTTYLPALASHWTWLPVHRPTLEKFSAVDRRGTKWTHPGNLVGNGPFALTEWAPNNRIVVSKNPHYRDAAHVRLNKIIFYPIESAHVEDRSFRAGQMHVTSGVPIAKVPAYRAQEPSFLRSDRTLGTTYLIFNTAKPPLGDVRVRRALSLAIDRDAISRAVSYGMQPPARALTAPDCGGYSARGSTRCDFEAARRLLAEAGYAGGTGLSALPLLTFKDDHMMKVTEAIQAMWQRELGVHTALERMDLKTALENMEAKQHTIAFSGWWADYADPATFLENWITAHRQNWSNWSDAAYDRMIAEAAHTLDAQARFEIFQRAEALLLAQLPISPIDHVTVSYLMHPAVKGWVPSVLGQYRYAGVRLEE
jgi:oligopeptide transport system substrate-binding protein